MPDTPPSNRPSTDSSYGIPDTANGLLEWSHAETRLSGDYRYWVATIRPDGVPHVRPTWGVWVDGRFHCGGGATTRWVRNLERSPWITVHTEDAESVVILEGSVERLEAGTADPDRLARIDTAYEDKYGLEHGTPVFAVEPDRVLAWTDFPADATRWTFEE